MKYLLRILVSKDLYTGISRYALGTAMIGYGIFKMWGYQGAYLSPASSWQLPFEALDGSQLIWAFVSYSGKFQFLLGLFEFLPGCMLLFRRTSLAGAILMLPLTIGVFLVNYALDLWLFTKIISAVLLSLNALILVAERKRISSLIDTLLSRKFPKFRIAEVIVNSAIILYLSRKLFVPLYDKEIDTKPFCGDCFNRHPNEWRLSGVEDDTMYSGTDLRIYFTPRGAYSEINAQNRSPEFLTYKVDKKNSVLSIEKGYYYSEDMFLLPSKEDTGIYSHFRYNFKGDSIMELRDQKGRIWHFTRRVINEERF